MIIYTTNILAAPLILVVWCIDIYLLMASLRLFLGNFHSKQCITIRLALQKFTDPLPQTLSIWLSTRCGKSLPNWQSWFLVIAGSLVVRHLMVLLVFAVSASLP